ncbi:MAG: hypothetical protein WCK57_11885 [Verrucomicrobiae bacterium]
MKLTFQLGFALILLGIAVSCGVNYLDMQQFEARLDQYVVHTSLFNYSDLGKIAKSKNLSPDTAALLNNQLTGADFSIKIQLENIRSEVIQKKSKALHSLGLFLGLAAMMGVVNYSTILKIKNQSAKLG